MIAALNLVVLVGILRVCRAMRSGRFDEAELERQLSSRGLMNRFYGRFTRMVSRPWHMYPLGLLFGLGFDTATEVALLFLAAGAAGAGLPFYAILRLPILFAAGMSLLDTIDGSLMNFAYGWAFSKPVRKVFYNIAITGLSVAIAPIVDDRAAGAAGRELGLKGAFWDAVSQINVNTLGYVIVGLFVAVLAGALLCGALPASRSAGARTSGSGDYDLADLLGPPLRVPAGGDRGGDGVALVLIRTLRHAGKGELLQALPAPELTGSPCPAARTSASRTRWGRPRWARSRTRPRATSKARPWRTHAWYLPGAHVREVRGPADAAHAAVELALAGAGGVPGAAHERGLSMPTRIGECSATRLTTTPSTLNPPRSSRSDRSSTSAASKPLRSAPTSTPSHSAIVLEASCGAEESRGGGFCRPTGS